MSIIFRLLGFIVVAFLGNRSEQVSEKLVRYLIWLLPPEKQEIRSEELLSNQLEIEGAVLKFADALSLAWQLRLQVGLSLFSQKKPIVEEAKKQARWKLDATQIANYGLAPSRVIDKVPDGCISVRAGGKIYVRTLKSTRYSTLVFDETTTNGLALYMSQNKNSDQLASKVLLSPDVVDAFVKNAFNSTDDLKRHFENGVSDSDDE